MAKQKSHVDNKMLMAKDNGQEIVMAETHAGPLPHPSIMKQYGEIDPSYPERIMKMTEDNNAAAIKDNAMVIEETFKERKRGQYLAFSTGVIGLVFGLVLVLITKSAYGVTPMIAGMVPLLVSAIEGMTSKNK